MMNLSRKKEKVKFSLFGNLSSLLFLFQLYSLVFSHRTTSFQPLQSVSLATFNRTLTSSAFRMTFDISDIEVKISNEDQKKLLLKTLEIATFFFTELIEPIIPTQGKIYPLSNMSCSYNFTDKQIDDGNTSDDAMLSYNIL